MDPETSFFLARISSYIMIGPCVLSLFRFKSPFQVHKQLAFVVFLGAFISIAANFFNVVLQMPNLFLLHIYTIFDFILLTLIFKDVLPQIVFKVLIFTFPLFAAVNSIFLEKLMTENVLNRSISAFLLMFYALCFFTKTLGEMKIIHLERQPMFWISVGVLFYNAGSFFIFLFSRVLTPIPELWYTYFGIHAIFTIILYCFYTIALWVQPKILPA